MHIKLPKYLMTKNSERESKAFMRLTEKYMKDKNVDMTLCEHLIEDANGPEIVTNLAKGKYKIDPNDLKRRYNIELVARGYGLSRSKLKKLNTIDLREYLYGDKGPDGFEIPFNKISAKISDITCLQYREMSEVGWLAAIPCFQEGMIILKSNRYLYWNIKEIDAVDHKVTIFVKDYIAFPTGWQPGVEGTFTLSEKASDKPLISSLEYYMEDLVYNSVQANSDNYILKCHDSICYPDIYTQLSQKDLSWNDTEMNLFNSTILFQAVFETALAEKRDNYDDVEVNCEFVFVSLAKIFIALTYIINSRLYVEKPVTEHKKKQPVKTTTVLQRPVDTDERKTRHVGLVRIVSKHVPKAPTEDSIRKYKVAVWPVRSHPRRLKNGKITMVKEHPNHRQCLLKKFPDAPKDAPKATIHMRKELKTSK